MPPESPPAINPDDIRKALDGRVFWCRLVAPVDQLFLRRRQEDFANLLRIGWPLLVMMLVAIGAVGRLLFPQELTGSDGVLWWRGLAAEALAIAIPILLLHLPLLLPHYQRVILVFGALTLAIPVLGTQIFDSTRLMQVNSYVALLVISILVLALRLSLLMSALASLLGIGLAVGVMLTLGKTVDWPMLSWACLGSLVVMLFVGAVVERQERISFLQGLLLEYESGERERLNLQLERLAHQDGLTHLANRRHFDQTLVREWDRLRREGRPMAVLFIDVDYFKPFNDTYGHAMGDECLAAVAAVLQQAARRPGDLAARYGGEEFVVLLPGTDVAGAREVAERTLAEVDRLNIPHAASQVTDHVTVSIGLAVRVPQGSESAQALLEMADKAVYTAKRSGRHRVVVHEDLAVSA